MTTDERLERLVERHEALTQTVELLAHQTGQNAKQLHELVDIVGRLTNVVSQHEKRIDKLEH